MWTTIIPDLLLQAIERFHRKMDSIQYRTATPDDAPDISSLLNELGYPVSSEEVKARLLEIRDGDGAVLVAARDKVIGCVHVFPDLRLAEGKAGEIVSLVVGSGLRGSGVGTGLIARAKAWSVEKGFGRLRVRANAVRDRAHSFYQQQGFELVKTQKVFIVNLEGG